MATKKLLDQVELPHGPSVSFRPADFDQAIGQHGVRLEHWRAMRCPVGMVQLGDNRRPKHDHSGCSNGFHYTRVGQLVCLFTSNDEAFKQHDVGTLDGSTVQATPQRFYTETDCDGNVRVLEEPVSIAPFDRFYLTEESITVPHWQLFEASIDGNDRLDYPVVRVHELMDSDGKFYDVGEDFDIKSGWIRWRPGKTPRWDAERNRGQVCGVRYQYRPFWYVERMPHQIRFAQVDDPVAGGRQVVTMPHQMVLVREYVHHDADADPETTLTRTRTQDRRGVAPRDNGFGPR